MLVQRTKDVAVENEYSKFNIFISHIVNRICNFIENCILWNAKHL